MTIDDLQAEHEARSRDLSARADTLLSQIDDYGFHGLRLALAKLGWISFVSVTSTGWGDTGYGFCVVLRRWDWHGRRTAGDPFLRRSVGADELTPYTADHTLRFLARRALTALRDMPDALPRWTRDGIMEPSQVHAQIFSTPMDRYIRPEWPTENIPEDVDRLGDAPFTSLLDTLIEAGRRGWDLTHEIDFMPFNPDRKCHDRTWGMRLKLMVAGRFGVHDDIMPHHHRLTCASLLASTGTRLAAGALAEMDALAAAYEDALPPGMRTYSDWRASKNR